MVKPPIMTKDLLAKIKANKNKQENKDVDASYIKKGKQNIRKDAVNDKPDIKGIVAKINAKQNLQQ